MLEFIFYTAAKLQLSAFRKRPVSRGGDNQKVDDDRMMILLWLPTVIFVRAVKVDELPCLSKVLEA